MAQSQSRSARWNDAVTAAKDAIQSIKDAQDSLEAAFSDLADLKQEYNDWYDNMPEALQSSSPTADKLQQIIDLDTDWNVGDDIDDAESKINDLEAADLPLGFGRD